MKRFLIVLMTIVLWCSSICAQRFTDNLDRGLVAVQTGTSGNSTTNLITWRRLADEYFGVTYNLYKDGLLLASGLTNTSYTDNRNGLPTTRYRVAAVVNGVEQNVCSDITPWSQYV